MFLKLITVSVVILFLDAPMVCIAAKESMNGAESTQKAFSLPPQRGVAAAQPTATVHNNCTVGCVPEIHIRYPLQDYTGCNVKLATSDKMLPAEYVHCSALGAVVTHPKLGIESSWQICGIADNGTCAWSQPTNKIYLVAPDTQYAHASFFVATSADTVNITIVCNLTEVSGGGIDSPHVQDVSIYGVSFLDWTNISLSSAHVSYGENATATVSVVLPYNGPEQIDVGVRNAVGRATVATLHIPRSTEYAIRSHELVGALLGSSVGVAIIYILAFDHKQRKLLKQWETE
eukprot:PhM_4_TR14959/c0_g1_i1/m.20641